MKAGIQEAITGGIARMPYGAYRRGREALIRAGKAPAAQTADLKRIGSGRAERDARGGAITAIREGLYEYEYFNVCFLNNVISLCALAAGRRERAYVAIRTSGGENLWEEFFEQPFAFSEEEMARIGEAPGMAEKVGPAFPQWQDAIDPRTRRLYSGMYRRMIRYRPEVQAYLDEELAAVRAEAQGGKMLGVLCRGTDYTATRPKGHPRQPEAEAILARAEEAYRNGKYAGIYLATEDSRYDTAFRERFGDKIHVNRREYYDRAYREGGIRMIRDVHFDRERDDYRKGIEYLSSLYILSRCEGLIAGNCGGSQAAAFLNGGKYEECYFFDLGVY